MKISVKKRGTILTSAVQGLSLETALLVPGGSTCSSAGSSCSCTCA
jgi:hypothetical protein